LQLATFYHLYFEVVKRNGKFTTLLLNLMNQKPVIAYPSQFAMLLGFLGLGLIVSGLLMSWLSSIVLNVPFLQVPEALLKPENVQFSRFANALTTFLAFFVPAWAVAKIAYKKALPTLGFNSDMNIKQVLAVGIISFGSLFLSGSLSAINEIIPMPATFLAKARTLENEYQQTMIALATMNNIGDLLLGLLVIAIAPAIFEEVLFRAGVQRVLVGLTKNAAVGIIISSIIFSAIHASYFGFLPRVALGVVLGLIYYLTSNLWLAILMHFLNNAVVVVQFYVYTAMGKPIKEAMNESMPIWYGLFGLMIVIPALLFLKKERTHILSKQVVPLYHESMD
jgi:membrane protease YdiL (CAAX protease family)